MTTIALLTATLSTLYARLLYALCPSLRYLDRLAILAYQLEAERQQTACANKRVGKHLAESVSLLARLDYLEPRAAALEAERDHYRDIHAAAMLYERRARVGDKMSVDANGGVP